MACLEITVTGGGSTGLKAVEFGNFWADNLDDSTLKIMAQLSIGDQVLSEPVHRENGYAYVIFQPNAQYTELGAGAAVVKIVSALFGWIKANPAKFTLVLGAMAYISIRIIDWETKTVEAEKDISKDKTIQDILASNLTNEQKLQALLEYLKSGAKGGTDWGLIILGGAAILGLAYLLGSRKGR